MKRFLLLALSLFAVAGCSSPQTFTAPRSAAGTRVTENFDASWHFQIGDVVSAEQSGFSDTNWSTVTLPHDWSISGPFDPKSATGGAGGFLPSGVGWYRKTFALPDSARERTVWVEFDGVMQNSDVWINGHHLGHRPYGYVSFRYELTPYLQFGAGRTNLIAVRADTAEQPASRWYSGAGIYRHVRLVTSDRVHLVPEATFVSSPPAPDFAPADADRPVTIRTEVVNASSESHRIGLHLTLVDPSGQPAAESETEARPAAPGQAASFERTIRVPHARLWDITSPQLYRAIVTVRVDGEVGDQQEIAFGIRDALFDSRRGFVLNGRAVKLYGVCLHHDGGAFGAAVPLAVWEQRLATLRTLGVNAIRTAHNPPDPGFLDLCDRLGFLVMDELFDCWTVGKNPYDYHRSFGEWSQRDVRDTVRRDRNHPSVVLYSAGNEIHDTPQAERAKAILAGLVTVFHENDPTRPVTQALFRPNVSHDYTNGLADLLDVIGTNYRDQELLSAWRAKPGRRIVGTEQRHDRETWLALRDNPAEAGQFLWTGVDYLGESRAWPIIGSASGLLDRTGAIRPVGRERQSWWTTAPMVAVTRRIAPDFVSHDDPGYEPTGVPNRRRQVLFSDWNPRNDQPHDETVEVYSNVADVELRLNGRSLGSQPLSPDAQPRAWRVAYAPGTLVAIARNAGKEVARDELRTAGAPVAVELTADRNAVSASWEEVVRVIATVVDAHGTIVPTADNLITFSVDGTGAVVAVDNGNNSTHEPFQTTSYHAYQGRCVAYVRATAATGSFSIQATSPGLTNAQLGFKVR